uniref:NADH-ubiquinone oxidoreductase chain 3 n=1 Tax=Elateroidea sp. 6 KM-2017 TaxID=2219429 RepID=A0A346RGC1_9COLE|nr:NADH dehydrogenase subunit 3 [Elateroidea sp. 6 KM-2017]
MVMTSYTMILTLAITTALICAATLLSKKTFSDREKMSPFECGFDPESSARIPFSLHFFLIAVIFLIFDVEITLILPFILTLKTMNMGNLMITFTALIMILLLGLYHEWGQGALKWTN